MHPSDRIVIADFANRTGENGLDATLKLALAVNLQREPSLEVLSDAHAREALRSLEWSQQTPVNGPVAREVCTLQQGAAVIEGSIAIFGSRYALGLEAVSCGTGAVIGREMVEARSKDEVLAALDLAAESLRRKLVEALNSARRNRPTQLAVRGLTDAPVGRARGR